MSEENPNVIVIMNEAFSDLSVIQSFETNEDYLPFFRSLTENTIKGQMVASIKGGGTCNTEFEFLTSSSQAFLPASFSSDQLSQETSTMVPPENSMNSLLRM